VGDEGVGVGPADGVEDLVHGGGQQVELVDEDHQRRLAAVDGAVVGELAGQPEVAAHGLGEVVGRGRHHGVRLGAAGTEARQPGDGVAHDLVDPADPGGDRRRHRTGGDHRLDAVERGQQVLARGHGGHDDTVVATDVLTAAEEAVEEPTRHVLTMPERLLSAQRWGSRRGRASRWPAGRRGARRARGTPGTCRPRSRGSRSWRPSSRAPPP